MEIIIKHSGGTYKRKSYFYWGLKTSEVHDRVGILTKPLRIIAKVGVTERGAYCRRVAITAGRL